jgi:hypothetical protein
MMRHIIAAVHIANNSNTYGPGAERPIPCKILPITIISKCMFTQMKLA